MAPAFRKRHPMSPGEPPDEMQQNEKEPLRPLEHSAKPSVTTKTASRSCQWFRLVWAVNLLFAVVVLSVGVWRNHAARKYIPINPTKLGSKCQKAFVNVMASSQNDPSALVCCDGSRTYNLTDVCPSFKKKKLPFAGRLAKFPDAWLLPLFPLLIRIFYMSYQAITSAGTVTMDSWVILVFRRLCFYVFLMNFRGWALYVGLNKLEDHVVTRVPTTCWYRDWLREGQSDCYGRRFDFSDHVVLYFGQILPIALVEVLHALEQPYWTQPRVASRNHGSGQSAGFHWLPFSLVSALVYLHFVTYLGAYKTSSFFHTGSEVFAGFLVSLLIQVLFWLLQCHERFARARVFFFGSPSPVNSGTRY